MFGWSDDVGDVVGFDDLNRRGGVGCGAAAGVGEAEEKKKQENGGCDDGPARGEAVKVGDAEDPAFELEFAADDSERGERGGGED